MRKLTFFAAIFFIFIIANQSFALSGSDNIGDWRKASYSERKQLCSLIAKEYGVTANDLYSCISETVGLGGMDNMKIAEVATVCILMMKNN